MIKKDYFIYEESVSHPGRYIIKPVFETFGDNLHHTEGSFNILMARIMGLSYADYLRMCRDILGAEIYGKGDLYPVAYFQKDKTLLTFLRVLNDQMNNIMLARSVQRTQAGARETLNADNG